MGNPGNVAWRKVKAETLIKELTQDQGSLLPSLQKRRVSLRLSNAIIEGPFNLKHHSIKKHIEIRDCVFKEKVDLTYCEFDGTVDFSGCIFEGVFNSGDKTESCTLYKKDLVCDGAWFTKPARFNSIRVEGSGYFNQARFMFKGTDKPLEELSPSDYPVDFTASRFGRTLECKSAVFAGHVSFNALKCDTLFLSYDRGCERGAQFKKGVNLGYASASYNIVCNGADFEGEGDFSSIDCRYHGLFQNVQFRELAYFRFATFGRNLQCDEHTVFRGKADFRSVQCGASLDCTNAEFLGGVDARGLKCGISARFFNARFEKAGPGGEVDFRFIDCGDSFDLRGAYFASKVRLGQARIGQKLRLGGSCFTKEVQLYDTNIKILELLNSDPTETKAVLTGEQAEALRKCVDLVARRTELRHKQQIDNLYNLCCNFTRIVKYYKRGAKEELYIRHYGSNIVELHCGDICKTLTKCVLVRSLFDKAQELERIEFIFLPGDIKDKNGEDDNGGARKQLSSLFDCVEAVLGRGKRLDRKVWTADGKLQKGVKECLLTAFFPFKEWKRSNLTEISFERFHGGALEKLLRKELATRFVEAQSPNRFSRDPYLQLESYYAGIGDEKEAARIHYKSHCDFRANALRDDKGRAQWSWRQSAIDFFWKWSIGYGHKSYYLVAWFTFIVLFGTGVFWTMGLQIDTFHVHPVETSEKEYVVNREQYVVDREHTLPLGTLRSWESVPGSLLYSLDLSIPVVSFGYGTWWTVRSEWQPWGDIYASMHAIVGWLYVVLVLAALTGLIKVKNE